MSNSNDERALANSLKAVETIKRLLVDMNLQPREQQLAFGVALHVAFDGPAEQGVAQVLTDAERFVFHFVFPAVVQEARRGSVAEFIARANWGLIEGNFELNMETGATRYKVAVDFTHTELTEPLVRNAILSGMNNIEFFFSGLEAVREGALEPKDAYEVYAPTNVNRPPQ